MYKMVGGIQSGDFINFPLADIGVTVSRTPVTKTIGFNGDETLTDGTAENITAVFLRRTDRWKMSNEALRQDADGYIMVAPTQTLNRDDKITYDGETYRVSDVIKRSKPVDVDLYKFANVFKIS